MIRCLLAVLVALAAWVRGGAEELRIYCEDAPPNQFRLPNDELGGMVVEVVREIQKELGTAEPIEMVPWARGYDALQKVPGTLLLSVARTS